ncbi:unnamed protein product [Anisakis simplex]|uniref:WAP domain-containing protein n=1 Tax=Anisakis simplex TaxID=6269 RepID=A0A0M3K7E0_ANISI|nr:unnamed protein product [Anisakis simplex]
MTHNAFRGQHCPLGYFCHRIGMDSPTIGYCCLGNESSESSEQQCPAVMSKAQSEPSKCSLECRQNTECRNGICCFNGCAVNGNKTERLGVCPAEMSRISECDNECHNDNDCPQFQKCCVTQCGHSCLFPHVATGREFLMLKRFFMRTSWFELKKD